MLRPLEFIVFLGLTRFSTNPYIFHASGEVAMENTQAKHLANERLRKSYLL